jgi:hypothetical protein
MAWRVSATWAGPGDTPSADPGAEEARA